MNRSHAFAIGTIATALLAGCASPGTAYQPPPQSPTVVVDAQYVGAVEQIARQRGTRVVWVNKPVRRVDAVARK